MAELNLRLSFSAVCHDASTGVTSPSWSEVAGVLWVPPDPTVYSTHSPSQPWLSVTHSTVWARFPRHLVPLSCDFACEKYSFYQFNKPPRKANVTLTVARDSGSPFRRACVLSEEPRWSSRTVLPPAEAHFSSTLTVSFDRLTVSTFLSFLQDALKAQLTWSS